MSSIRILINYCWKSRVHRLSSGYCRMVMAVLQRLYIRFYRPLLHWDIFHQALTCLHSGRTRQLRTINCQYVELPSLNINSISSQWVPPEVLSRWLGKGTVPSYQSVLLCQLLKWRFKVELKVNFQMINSVCWFSVDKAPTPSLEKLLAPWLSRFFLDFLGFLLVTNARGGCSLNERWEIWATLARVSWLL